MAPESPIVTFLEPSSSVSRAWKDPRFKSILKEAGLPHEVRVHASLESLTADVSENRDRIAALVARMWDVPWDTLGRDPQIKDDRLRHLDGLVSFREQFLPQKPVVIASFFPETEVGEPEDQKAFERKGIYTQELPIGPSELARILKGILK